MSQGQFMLTREQSKAARALLGWTPTKLAKKSRLSLKDIKGFERGTELLSMADKAAIKNAIEKGGVSLISESENAGVGVRYSALPAPRI